MLAVAHNGMYRFALGTVMRAVLWVVLVTLGGCLDLAWEDDDNSPPWRPAVRTATMDDLVTRGAVLAYDVGWTGLLLQTNASFWDAMETKRVGSSLTIAASTMGEGYTVVGVRAKVDGSWGPGDIIGFPGGLVTFTWDPAVLGERPELEFLLLGGGPSPGMFLAGMPGQGEDLPFGELFLGTLNGTDGGAGYALRVPFNATHVILLEHGVVRLEESYVGGTVTPAGTVMPFRETVIVAADRLSNPGVGSWIAFNMEPAGAAVWHHTTSVVGHHSEFTGAGVTPLGGQADAQLMYWQGPVGAGDIRIAFDRVFSGLTQDVSGALYPLSVLYFTCGWADVDLAAIGWEVPFVTPEDVAVGRVLELLPLPPERLETTPHPVLAD